MKPTKTTTIDDIMGTAKPSTKAQLKAFLELIEALRQGIEAAGDDGIPAGHLYAMVMGHGIELPLFEKCIGILVEAGRVTRSPSHLLKAVPL